MKFLKVLKAVTLIILIAVLGVLIFGNYSIARDADKAKNDVNIEDVIATPDPTPTPTPEETDDPNAKDLETVTLAYAGDIVCHSGLNTDANQNGTYDYTKIMSGASKYISEADYAVCTLETTFPNTSDYTGYPMFKSPAGLATSLSSMGFDLISTASNHCMDSYQDGLIATLDVLDQNNLAHVGTYRTQEERDENNGITIADIGGVKAAFLAYTYGTNGMPVTGFEYAANIYHTDYLTNLTTIDYDMLDRDMAAARALDTDIIIVFMHWGNEYYTSPVDEQKELADYMFEQGADIILGGHTHVPEPMELREVTDLDGNKKTGYLCYSLGNFISCQNDQYTNLTAVVDIEIQKNTVTGETKVKSAKYHPMFMVDLDDYGITNAGWRYRLWDLHAAIDAYNSGAQWEGVSLTDAIYQDLQKGLTDLYTIFDKDMDAAASGGETASEPVAGDQAA